MEKEKIVKLTSAEWSQLWTSYMNDSANICILKQFLYNIEDVEIKPLLEETLEISSAHLMKLNRIFNGEKFPVPYGFKESEDVKIDSARLFSDGFVLNYLHNFAKIDLQTYSVSLSFAVREDIFSYYSECLFECKELLKKARELLLSKGIYTRSPYLPIPEHVDFVKDPSFLTGFFGKKRPLTALEITNLYGNFQRNALGEATLMGFSQVATDKEVINYLIRGKEIASKHCSIFAELLRDNDLPVPMGWGSEVMDSTGNTFSDKLMIFYTTALIALGVGYYGISVSTSQRRDIGLMYNRLVVEVQNYSEDGANLLIKNGWLEEPPRALDRDELAKQKR